MMNPFVSKTVLIKNMLQRTARRCLNTNRIAQTAFPSRYIQGPGAISMLPSLVSKHFNNSGFMIVDPFVHDHILPTLKNVCGEQLSTQVFGGESSEEEIERLVEIAKSSASPAGCVIGLGGGKTMDTGTYSTAIYTVEVVFGFQ